MMLSNQFVEVATVAILVLVLVLATIMILKLIFNMIPATIKCYLNKWFVSSIFKEKRVVNLPATIGFTMFVILRLHPNSPSDT